jgi:hypothetical protein
VWRGNASGGMGRVTLLSVIGLIIFVSVVVVGGLFLAYWDLPAPAKPVEKVLPDARFPK